MEFYTQNKRVRPIRLTDKTRKFAYDSLNKRYGLDTLKNDGVNFDGVLGFESLSDIEKYDLAIKEIAIKSPIRICEDEKISGSATFGRAILHHVPATYKGDYIFWSNSHLTADFESVLKYGVNKIIDDTKIAYEKYKGTDREAFINSCFNCLDAFKVWHNRYLQALKDLPGYEENYKNLLKVPFKPATNFYEAVQSIWFAFAFMRLCGNWPGIGRIDYLLGDYLKRDLRDGTQTIDSAREILAHFFIKGCEWINGQYIGSGDAQHYQNILLAGIDENGVEVTNEVTYLVLDILEELGISDFPTTVRINKNTDEKLIKRVAEVMRYGGGMLAVYNEDLIIETFIKNGYPLSEARKFANDGCWEVQVPGKTNFGYIPFDSLQILQQNTLDCYSDKISYSNFEDLYQKYIKDLRVKVADIINGWNNQMDGFDDTVGAWKWKKQRPSTVVSLFEQGCISKGASYNEGGAIYNIISPHIGGVADTVNSLYAIKKLVFEEKKVTLAKLMQILKNNWVGEEVLRQYALNKYSYFGNDNDEVDLLCARLLSDFSDICSSLEGNSGYKFPSGVSTFGRQIEWAEHRLATAYGKKAGQVLAQNCSPTPSTDKQGATAIIRSYCKIDLTKLATGAALDLKLLPSSVDGDDGLEALVSLIRGFVALGGFFMQPDVVDAELLKLAQKDPKNYQTLSVRVSGWNARFVTLDKEWQDMVIEQNER